MTLYSAKTMTMIRHNHLGDQVLNAIGLIQDCENYWEATPLLLQLFA